MSKHKEGRIRHAAASYLSVRGPQGHRIFEPAARIPPGSRAVGALASRPLCVPGASAPDGNGLRLAAGTPGHVGGTLAGPSLLPRGNGQVRPRADALAGTVLQPWIYRLRPMLPRQRRGRRPGRIRRRRYGGRPRRLAHACQLPFVDARRISIMGFSRGAINAARTAASAPGIHRLILWSGVSDLAQTYEERVDLRRMLKRVLGGTPARQEAAFRLRSPLHLAERIGCPVLLIHGTEDEQVPYAHAIRMRDRLASLGKESTLHAYAGEGHLFPPGKHREAVERMFRWIEETGR